MRKKIKPIMLFFLIAAIVCGVLLIAAIVIGCVSTASSPLGQAAIIIAIIGGAGAGLELIAYILYRMFSKTKTEECEECSREEEACEGDECDGEECEGEAYEGEQEPETWTYETLKMQTQAIEDWKLQNIKKTLVITSTAKKDKGNSVTRGIVGGLLFGPVGSVIGATTSRENTFTTFLVIYNDDSRETVEVENGSERFQLYIKYLET